VIVIGPVDSGDNLRKTRNIDGLKDQSAVDNRRIGSGRIGDLLGRVGRSLNLSPGGSWRSTEVVPRLPMFFGELRKYVE
jgi:hypothetical protein